MLGRTSISRARHTILMLLVLVPTIATFAATSYFKPAKVYISAPNNTGTTAIAVADLNRDGKPDLVVGDVVGTESNNSGYVGVLLGNGNGTFRPIHTFPSGGHAVTSVAVGDLNGDGKIDVAVSQLEGVAVLLGKGNGTFQPAQTYAINSLAGNTGIAIADVNGDGHPDLLVAVECDPTYPDCNHQGDAGVMLGNGDGTFGPVQLYGSGGSFATSIAVADVNLDGKLDLILDNAFDTAGDGHGSVAVLLGNGDGTFQATQNYDIGGYDGGSVTVADLNGDGKPDLVAANDCASNNCALSTLGVLLGNGDGTFQKVKIITGTGGWTTLQVAVTDVNGDSIPDLLVDNFCDNNTVCDHGTVGLLLGHGDGTFGQAQRYNSGGLYANSFAIADVNGDGFADVFVAHGSAICCGSEGVVGVLLSSH